jgi:hypothetical protein
LQETRRDTLPKSASREQSVIIVEPEMNPAKESTVSRFRGGMGKTREGPNNGGVAILSRGKTRSIPE